MLLAHLLAQLSAQLLESKRMLIEQCLVSTLCNVFCVKIESVSVSKSGSIDQISNFIRPWISVTHRLMKLIWIKSNDIKIIRKLLKYWLNCMFGYSWSPYDIYGLTIPPLITEVIHWIFNSMRRNIFELDNQSDVQISKI